MISGPRIDVRIGNRIFNVPRLKDEDTTYHIAKMLSDRLKKIEAKSSRIDSQAFAIEAAMSFALDLLYAQEDLGENTTEMMTALADLSKQLQTICQDYDIPDEDEEA